MTADNPKGTCGTSSYDFRNAGGQGCLNVSTERKYEGMNDALPYHVTFFQL